MTLKKAISIMLIQPYR